MRLVDARTRKLLSLRELARLSGANISTVIATEKGQTIPSLRTVERLSKALGVDPEEVDEFAAALRRARREV